MHAHNQTTPITLFDFVCLFVVVSFFLLKNNLVPLYSIPRRLEIYFRLNEVPSVNLALPPVGWQRTVAHEPQVTTV